MKSPYSGRIGMWSVASGAGAYSHGTLPRAARPHEAGAGLVSGFLVSVTPRLWHRAARTDRRPSATLDARMASQPRPPKPRMAFIRPFTVAVVNPLSRLVAGHLPMFGIVRHRAADPAGNTERR